MTSVPPPGANPDDDFDRLVVRPSRPSWSASYDPECCCNQRDDLTMHDIPPFSCCWAVAPPLGSATAIYAYRLYLFGLAKNSEQQA
jgi:hypothetical protein